MYFDLFYPPSLSCIRKIVHHYDLVQQLFGVEEQKVNVTLSDRGSLIALLQNKHPVYWHRLQGFPARTQRNIIMFTQRREKEIKLP